MNTNKTKTLKTLTISRMMRANDSKELAQRQREKEIKRLFKEHLGITVKFVP